MTADTRFATWLAAPGVVLAGLLLSVTTLSGCEKKSSAAVEQPAARIALAWDTQKAHVYQVELSTTLQLSGAPTASTITLRSPVKLTFRDNAGVRQALVQLQQPKLLDASGNASPEAAPLEAELGRPFAVELSRGVATAYLELPAAVGAVTGFRRQLAALLQFSDHAPGPDWKSTEWDSTGLANVAYRSDAKTPGAFSWSKLGYERLVKSEHRAAQALDTSKVAPKVESATGSVSTDASGILRLERKERFSVPLSAATTLVTDLAVRLERTGFEPVVAADWDGAQRDWQRVEVGTPVQTFDQKTTDEARIGQHTFSEVVTKLTELEPKSGAVRAPAAQAGPLFHALVGILRQEPGHVAEAARLARGNSPIRDTLLDALAMASTPQALDALAQLAFDASLPQPLRVRAAGSLIRAHEPGERALELAVKMIDTPLLRENGLYGVGSFVRQLRDQGKPALADVGTQVLARQLEVATTPSDLSTVLLAISNSGSPELLKPVLAYQQHANPSVRHAAIQAIRLMPQPEVEERLRAVLDSKERGDVVAALHSLGRRPQASRESVDRVAALAKQDPSPEVRREAVLVLGFWSQTWPELKAVLADLREHDSDARVREVAKPLGPQ